MHDIPEKYHHIVMAKKQRLADAINTMVSNFGPHRCRASDIPDDDPDVMMTMDAIRNHAQWGEKK